MNGQFTQRGMNGKQMWMLYYPKLNDANDVRQTIVDGKPLCIFQRKLTHSHIFAQVTVSQNIFA